MKIKYYKEDDILVFQLSPASYDYAEMEGDFIVHFTKDEKPVRIEVLNARNFLKKESQALPRDIKQEYFVA